MHKTALFSLNEKVCVVTGGSGDIGIAIADAFLGCGARVIIAGRSEDRLKAAVAKREGASGRLFTYSVDVADLQAVVAMTARLIEQHGQIDVLVTAAGIQHRCPALEFPASEWDKVIQTNLNGTFYCAQSVGKHMVSRGSGRVIMVTSLTAEIGIPNIAAYAASRGAIKQLCMTLAVELASSGVTVNCIGPGRIATNMTGDIMADQAKYERTLQVIPMRRWGKPDDIGGAAVFLASDAASYITGQSFYVDGGWLAGGGNLYG